MAWGNSGPPAPPPPPAYGSNDSGVYAQGYSWVNAPSIAPEPANINPPAHGNIARSRSPNTVTAPQSRSSSSTSKDPPPGFKELHVYLESWKSTSLNVTTADKTPYWSVRASPFSNTIKIKSPKPSSKFSGSSGSRTLAAARLHTFSTTTDLCIGDPDHAQYFDKMSSEHSLIHFRYRWTIDASYLPPHVTREYPPSAEPGTENKVRFVWRHANDTMVTSDWECVLDDEGFRAGGEKAVVARWRAITMSMKKRGRLEMREGWGERWELLCGLTFVVVLEKQDRRHKSS